MATIIASAVAGAAAMTGGGYAQAAPHDKTIYQFRPDDRIESRFVTGLAADLAGNLYGVAGSLGPPYRQSCGSVFRLQPQAANGPPWTFERLYAFARGTADGCLLSSRPLLDPLGNLYGTLSLSNGSEDSVWQLSPPSVAGGPWTLQTILAFSRVGGFPTVIYGNLVNDSSGVLYGIMESGDNPAQVFSLTPPTAGGTWTETVLQTLDGEPSASLVISPNGADLFGIVQAPGSTKYCEEVYRLHRVGSVWRETTVYHFACQTSNRGPSQYPSLFISSSGVLFGTTIQGGAANKGTVFELLPPSSGQNGWTEQVLHSFSGADGTTPNSLVSLAGGTTLFGTTRAGGSYASIGSGTVFRLDPSTGGSSPWTLTTLFDFRHATGSPTRPYSPLNLTFGRHRLLFGTTEYGGVPGDIDRGAVFSQTRN